MALLPTFPFDVAKAAELLGDDETLGTVVHAILLAAYGQSLYGDIEQGEDFLPEIELRALILEDFNVEASQPAINRLRAIMLACADDAFYTNPGAFAAIANSLHEGELPDAAASLFEDLTVPEILWATWEVAANRDEQDTFSPAVQAVIDKIVASEREDQQIEVTYYERFMLEQRMDLEVQLKSLGVPLKLLAQLPPLEAAAK